MMRHEEQRTSSPNAHNLGCVRKSGERSIRMSKTTRTVAAVLGLVVLLSGGAVTALAQCELAKLVPSIGRTLDGFGVSVSISGDVAVVGSWMDDGAGENAGAAYIYQLENGDWVEKAKLTAPDAAPEDQFGWSVAVSGDTVVVGASFDDDRGVDSGSAYVFRNNGGHWLQEVKLTALDGAPDDQFGMVAVTGAVIAVGAWNEGNSGPGHVDGLGAAYMYRFDGIRWNQEAKLVAADAAIEDWFGVAVSVIPGEVLVGAVGEGNSGPGQFDGHGAAYLFQYDTVTGLWEQEQKLIASDAAPMDFFGNSVSIRGDVAVIGALYNDDHGADSGSAYVFRFDTTTGRWHERQKLTASDAEAGECFGTSVSTTGEVALIGASHRWTAYNGPGAAYVYRYDGTEWNEQVKLKAADGDAEDEFGLSVSLSEQTALIGAWRDDHAGGTDAGSAYAVSLGSCGLKGDLNFARSA